MWDMKESVLQKNISTQELVLREGEGGMGWELWIN